MQDYVNNIGKNIREVRLERRLSQEAVALKCDFSNTTLSAYENSKKIPNLVTIAKIAKALNVSIDRLYYGDENIAFISSENNIGRKVVNAVYYLWSEDVVAYREDHSNDMYRASNEKYEYSLLINRFPFAIRRLILALNEYKNKQNTYNDPDTYLNMLLDSVAKEINNEISAAENKKARFVGNTDPRPFTAKKT